MCSHLPQKTKHYSYNKDEGIGREERDKYGGVGRITEKEEKREPLCAIGRCVKLAQ